MSTHLSLVVDFGPSHPRDWKAKVYGLIFNLILEFSLRVINPKYIYIYIFNAPNIYALLTNIIWMGSFRLDPAKQWLQLNMHWIVCPNFLSSYYKAFIINICLIWKIGKYRNVEENYILPRVPPKFLSPKLFCSKISRDCHVVFWPLVLQKCYCW